MDGEPRLKPIKRRLPKKALIPLMEFCEWIVEEHRKLRGVSPAEFFRRLLEMMLKYQGYFFERPWPKRFVYEEAAYFSERDAEFIFEGGEEDEFFDRFLLAILKRLINHENGLTWEPFFQWIYDALMDYLEKLVEEAREDETHQG